MEKGDRFVNNIKISRNQQITCLHVHNASMWLHNTKHVLIERHTLLFDYIYFLHPTAIGHWYAASARTGTQRVQLPCMTWRLRRVGQQLLPARCALDLSIAYNTL